MAVFRAYIDDSGTAPSQQVAIASVFIIPKKQVTSLENEWASLKKKEGFSCFHMAEFAALNPKSEFATWANKQERVANRVRQIIKKFGTHVISFSVNKSDYDELMPDDLRRYAGKNHYTWAIRSVVAMLDTWAARANVSAPLEYVFDFMKPSDPNRREIEEVMAQAEDDATKAGRLGTYLNYGFQRRCDVSALQCADVLAWTCYQHSLSALKNIPMKVFAEDMWNDFWKARGQEWLSVYTIQKEHLAEWIQKEINDGRSIEKFKTWQAQHPENKR